MSQSLPTLIILGAGPAGLALAAAAAERGMTVQVVDPSPDRTWAPTYGAWAHDLPDHVPLSATWTLPTADLGAGPRPLGGTYARIDKHALRDQLLGRLADHGGELVTGRAAHVAHHPSYSEVHLHRGPSRRGAVVVNAIGRSLDPGAAAPTAFQAAYGILAEVDHHPWAEGEMRLMDFSSDHLSPTERDGVPSFLYALPLASNLVFLEETSLAARPAVPLELLRSRLYKRLAHLGIHASRELEVERCIIPMNTPIPTVDRLLPFGAAAGLVHPATGYQLTRALHLAAPVAAALDEHLDQGPLAAVQAAWAQIWPAPLRRTRALHDLGLELLLSLDDGQTASFFQCFFDLPEPSWRAYLSATSTPGQVARAMTQVFARLDPPLRRAIVALALGRGRSSLLRVLNPQLRGAS